MSYGVYITISSEVLIDDAHLPPEDPPEFRCICWRKALQCPAFDLCYVEDDECEQATRDTEIISVYMHQSGQPSRSHPLPARFGSCPASRAVTL